MFGYSCVVFVLVAGLRLSSCDSEPTGSHRPVIFARVDFSKEDGGVEVKSVDVPVDAVDWNNLETLETGGGSEFMEQVRKFRPKWDDDDEEEDEDEDEEEEEEANEEEELATKHQSGPESEGTSLPKPPQTRTVIFARLDLTKDSADEAVRVESVEVPVDAVDWKNLETLETGGGHEFLTQVKKYRPNWDDEDEENDDEDEEEEEEEGVEEKLSEKQQLSCDGKKQASENVLQQCDDGEKPQN